MEFDDQRVDASQLDDLRGGRGRRAPSTGTMVGAGAGGLGVIGLLLALLLGVNPFEGGAAGFPDAAAPAAPTASSDVAVRCNAAGAIEEYDDCYVLKSFNEVNEVWSEQFARSGDTYPAPRLVFFEGAVRTGCGNAPSATGPFYCPPDRRVYIDLGFLRQLQQEYGFSGRYAQSYIVAHEVGHHLQTVLGIEAQVRRAQQRDPGRANALSVRLELQADCMAGVYGRLADDAGNQVITRAELDQAIAAASAVGDDRIQAGAGMRVDPESFTHGSAEQRRQWYLRGFDAGTLDACDTFA